MFRGSRFRLVVALACALLAGLAVPAAGQARIVEGKSIAGVKLGATKAKVKRVLGTPNDKASGSWFYTGNGDPGMRIHFRKGRVDDMLLFKRTHVTRKKIGIRSTVAKVQAAYPDADCALDPNQSPYIPICFVAGRYHGKKTETYFRFDKPDGRVVEVSVHFGSMLG